MRISDYTERSQVKDSKFRRIFESIIPGIITLIEIQAFLGYASKRNFSGFAHYQG